MNRTNVALAIIFVVAGATVVALVPREAATDPSRSASDAPGTWAHAWKAANAATDGGGASEPTASEGEISVLTLLGEMADLEHLSRTPRPTFTSKQAASTDRRSTRPEDGESWFANDDFATNNAPNLVRVETNAAGERRYVLLDAKGPGAVVRLWTATPTGTLRIFVDDQPQPVLEAPMGALLGGRVSPFTPPFGQVTAMGHSLYFPFPFQRRCLITLDTLEAIDPFSGRPIDKVYYQIGYRAYPADSASRVRSFSATEVARAHALLARVGAALGARRPLNAPDASGAATAIAPTSVDETRPSSTTIQAPAGGGVIVGLRLATSGRDPERLRALTLSIAFDGEETVRAPLTDFFGTGPGLNPYDSLPFTVGADGTLECRFVMPFRERAVVTLSRARPAVAADAAPPLVEISGMVTVAARPFADNTLLFHARARGPERLPTRPLRDWHLATLDGHGQQVGTMLSVRNPPDTYWWGEGDEKIFVDGEAFPSIFGTGTEDYFGYAWSSTERFSHAYHAQTLAPPPGAGFGGWFSMNRFLVLDPVPFTSRLKFDLELWHWSDTTVEMAAVMYWYARPGSHDDLPR